MGIHREAFTVGFCVVGEFGEVRLKETDIYIGCARSNTILIDKQEGRIF